MKDTVTSRFAPALVALCAVMWSTTGTAAALQGGGVSPFVIGAATLGGGGLLMGAAFGKRAIHALRTRGASGWIIAGGIAITLYAPAFYTSMSWTGVAVGTALNIGTAPLFAAVLERVLDRYPLQVRWGCGIAIAFTGLGCLLFFGEPREDASAAVNVVWGSVLGVVAGFLFAFYTVASRRALKHRPDARGVMAAMFGSAGILLTPVLLVSGAPLIESPTSLGLVTYQILVPGFAAWLLFGVALHQVTGRTATTLTLLEPVAAAVWASLLVGQHLTGLGWISLVVVVGGVALAAMPATRQRATLAPLPHDELPARPR